MKATHVLLPFMLIIIMVWLTSTLFIVIGVQAQADAYVSGVRYGCSSAELRLWAEYGDEGLEILDCNAIVEEARQLGY